MMFPIVHRLEQRLDSAFRDTKPSAAVPSLCPEEAVVVEYVSEIASRTLCLLSSPQFADDFGETRILGVLGDDGFPFGVVHVCVRLCCVPKIGRQGRGMLGTVAVLGSSALLS